MPALTTARTTAFMPALSPPEVRTASFIVKCWYIFFPFTGPRETMYYQRKTGVGVGNYDIRLACEKTVGEVIR